MFFMFAMGYLIARDGLFDLKFFMIRAISYTVVMGTLGLVYLTIFGEVFKRTFGIDAEGGKLYLIIIAMMLVALAALPIARWLNRFLLKIFSSYDVDKNAVYITNQLNQLLSSTNSIAKISQLIKRTFVLSYAGIVALDKKGEQRVYETTRYDFDRAEVANMYNSAAVANKKVIFLEDAPNETFRVTMLKYGLAAVIKLSVERDEMIGLLMMGKSKGKTTLDGEDVRSLVGVSNIIALAVKEETKLLS
jgi:hypothetical protein